MKVRKRPVIVDAYQIKDIYFLLNAPDWVLKACSDNTIFGYFSDDKEGVRINTLEGIMFAPFGHYLIRGVEGEIYGCDPNVFKKTYEIMECEQNCDYMP